MSCNHNVNKRALRVDPEIVNKLNNYSDNLNACLDRKGDVSELDEYGEDFHWIELVGDTDPNFNLGRTQTAHGVMLRRYEKLTLLVILLY